MLYSLRSLFAALAVFIAVLASPALAQEDAPPEADIVVSKSGPPQAAAGSNVAYTITIANAGGIDAENVTLTDPLPAGMTFVSLTQNSGPAFSCATPPVNGPGTVVCTLALLAVGETASFTLVAQIDPQAAPGSVFVNIASGSTTTTDNTDENNSGVAGTSTPPAPQADLGVMKSGPVSAPPGGDVTYTITVTNGGPDDADDVTLLDTLPGTMTFVSLSQPGGPAFSCTTPAIGAGGTIDCSLAILPALTTATFTLTGNIPADTAPGTTFQNSVVVDSTTLDPNEENDAATTTLTTSSVDLSVTKSGPAAANAGDDLTYTITIVNDGPDAAFGVTLTDTLPENTTFVSMTQNNGPPTSCNGTPLICSWESLGAGASAQFTLVVTAGNTTLAVNTAEVATSGSFDTDPSDDSDSVSTTITPRADLALTKDGPATVTAGTDATFTIDVTNNGPSDAASITVTDPIPANTTFVSASAGCTADATTVTCTQASLLAGQSTSFTIVFRASPAAMGTIDNTATVTAATADPNAANDQDTASATVTAVADLGVVKTGPAGVTAGSNITWTIALTNHGPSNAANVALDDALPPGTTFVSFAQDSGPAFACTAPPVHCTIATLGAGASATFTLVATVSPAATGSIDNTAVVTSATADPVAANDSSTATAVIGATADLSIAKIGPASITSGQDATYTVTVANAGPSDALNVTLSDPLPPNTTLVSATQDSGPAFTCDATIQCTIASFPAGASATFTFVLRVDPAAFEPVVNTATATSPTTDPTPGNASASVATAVVAGPTDVRIAKSVSAPAPVTGATATYTIDVTNDGPGTAVNTVVTDVLPAGTTFTSATSTQGSCSGTTTVTCTVGTLAPGQTETITLVLTLPAVPTLVVNTATVTSDNTDTDPANDTSTAELTVQPGAAVPALSPLAMIAMAAGLAMIALLVQR